MRPHATTDRAGTGPLTKQIADSARTMGHPVVSHEWIYRHIERDKAARGELYKHLCRQRKRYRKRYRKRCGSQERVAPVIEEQVIRPGIQQILSGQFTLTRCIGHHVRLQDLIIQYIE